METKIKVILGILIILAAIGGYILLSGEDGKQDDRVVPPNVTQPPEPVVKNLAEAIALIKEKYSEVVNISKCENVGCDQNIIVGETENGWNLTFWNGSGDCRDSCLFKDYHYFSVYENDSVIKVDGEKWVNKTVRIWTDKLEYKMVEVVKVYIFNGLDEDISFYLETYPSDINIEKWENDTWNQYSITPFATYELMPQPTIIDSNRLFTFAWDQRYYVIWEDKELVNKFIINQQGKYKFIFKPINSHSVLYSNEFRIINSTKNGNNK